MGNSHYRSNLVAFAGTETIKGFNTASMTSLKADSYININGKYILTTTYSLAASVQAAATLAIGGTCPKGSVSLGAGELWLFTADNVATMLTAP